jgi:hypothetical protein
MPASTGGGSGKPAAEAAQQAPPTPPPFPEPQNAGKDEDRMDEAGQDETEVRPKTPLDRAGLWFFYWVLLTLSLSHLLAWAIAEREKARFKGKESVITTIYLLVTTAGLVVVWALNPTSEVFGWIAAYRWLEIFTFGIGVAFVLRASRLGDSWVAIALYALSVTLIFAILDHVFAGGSYKLAHGSHPFASRPFDYLYIAWTQMVTLGNEYELLTKTARGLAMAAATSGLLILGILVAGALSRSRDNSPPGE